MLPLCPKLIIFAGMNTRLLTFIIALMMSLNASAQYEKYHGDGIDDYTDIKNGMTEETKTARLLPFHRKTFVTDTEEKAVKEPFEFTPSVREVLEGIIPSYVSGFIYSALIDSFCSEQSARMTAMNAADQNAEELLKDLSVQYNRARQAAITQEITEVSAGERAQRSKKEKEG